MRKSLLSLLIQIIDMEEKAVKALVQRDSHLFMGFTLFFNPP